MKCVICKSSNIFHKLIDEEVRIDKDIYFVKINTPVCAECGERYYDRNTMKKLENLEKEIKEEKICTKQVGVVREVESL